MGLENRARCNQCQKWKGEENGWRMGELYFDVAANRLVAVVEHFEEASAKGKQTWCGIPCIQQAIGKELERDSSSEPRANPAHSGTTGGNSGMKP